jgi:predicted metalloprotease
VIAHEFGHHVQNLLGINEQVTRLQQEQPDEANDLSVRLELQADCMAGIWGYTTQQRGILEEGEVQEGLDAAAAVGDDRIQKEATGRTNPETWTHGSSEQRADWFATGFQSGDPDRCDTFAGDV